MKLSIKSLFAVVGAAAFVAVPATASAARVYFLLGSRHIFQIGVLRDYHAYDRQKIEQDYADQVADDQNTYNQHVQNGADQRSESQYLSQALTDLARERDVRLGQYYQLRDDLKYSHPELQVQGDGPYQVIGIDEHPYRDSFTFVNFCAYAPWPGYIHSSFYGWTYGVVYTPVRFRECYSSWHNNYIDEGRPAYYGLCGHNGGITVNININAGNTYVFHRGPAVGGGFRNSGSVGGGYNRHAFNGAIYHPNSGGNRPSGWSFRNTYHPTAGATQGHSHPGGYPTQGHHGTGSTTTPPFRNTYHPTTGATHGYSHPGGYPTQGSTNHSTGHRPSGSFGGHGTPNHSAPSGTNHGSFGSAHGHPSTGSGGASHGYGHSSARTGHPAGGHPNTHNNHNPNQH